MKTEFMQAYQEELEAIRTGFHDHDPNYAPKLALVVGTKRHLKKFFSQSDNNARVRFSCLID